MGCSQLTDATKRAGVRDTNKSLRSAARTFMFGTCLFDNGLLDYEVGKNVPRHISLAQVVTCQDQMRTAYESSELPKTPDVSQFKDYLYELRLHDLKNHDQP